MSGCNRGALVHALLLYWLSQENIDGRKACHRWQNNGLIDRRRVRGRTARETWRYNLTSRSTSVARQKYSNNKLQKYDQCTVQSDAQEAMRQLELDRTEIV